MSSGADTLEERFARRVVEVVTGAKVTRTDHGSAPPGTVDARLDYRDGRTGALEISTLGESSEFYVAAKLRELQWRLPMPGLWKWAITVTNVDELTRVQEIYEKVILTCEEWRVATVSELPDEVVESDPDFLWLIETSTVWFFGIEIPEGSRDLSGFIDIGFSQVMANWLWAPDRLVEGLNNAFTADPLAKRIAKLSKTEAEERHLFLRVTVSGLGEGVLIRLIEYAISTDLVPAIESDPDLPGEITHLWLLTGWGQRVTRWTRGRGWDHPAFNETSP